GPGCAEGSQESRCVTEVATFRSDGAYSDGRHPDAVRYTTSAEEDVKRRDFTINGLLLDPDKLAPLGFAAVHPGHKDENAGPRGFSCGAAGNTELPESRSFGSVEVRCAQADRSDVIQVK